MAAGRCRNDALKSSCAGRSRSGVIRNMARFMPRDLPKGGQLEDIANLIGLACAATMLMISHAEKQQDAALDRLSSYELKPQSVLYDDPDLKQVTTRSPDIER